MHWLASKSSTWLAPVALFSMGLCVVATACGGGTDNAVPPAAGTIGTTSIGDGGGNTAGAASGTRAGNSGDATTSQATTGGANGIGDATAATKLPTGGGRGIGGSPGLAQSSIAGTVGIGGVSANGGASTVASTNGGASTVASTNGGASTVASTNGGASANGGGSTKSAPVKGGTSSWAGTSSGTTIATGGSNVGGTDGCNYTPPKSCSKNSECHSGEFCDTDACDSSCSCVGGSVVCTNACVHRCKAGTCTAPTSGFVQRIHDNHPRNVVARVNASATEILGYQVVSGTNKTVDGAALEATMASWSSLIDWSKASVYSDSARMAYYYQYPTDAAGNYAGAVFSGSTGENLLLYTSWTDPEIPGVWLPASDLNGSCNVWTEKYAQPLGPWDRASDPGDAVMELLNRHGFNAGISTGMMGAGWELGGCSSYVILRTNSNPVEYVVIAHLSICA